VRGSGRRPRAGGFAPSLLPLLCLLPLLLLAGGAPASSLPGVAWASENPALSPSVVRGGEDFSEEGLAALRASLESRIGALDARLRAASRDDLAGRAIRSGVSAPEAKRYGENLLVLRNLYLRSLGSIRRMGEFDRQIEDLRTRTPEPLSVPPPYPLSFYDVYRGEKEDVEDRIKDNEFRRKELQDEREGNQSDLEATLRERRRLKESLDRGASDPTTRAGLDWRLRLAEQDRELAQAAEEYFRIRLKELDSERTVLERERDLLSVRVGTIRSGLRYDSGDLAEQTARARDRAAEYARIADGYAARLEVLDGLLRRTAASADPGRDVPARTAETAALELERELCRKMEDQFRQGSYAMLEVQETWEERYALLRGDPFPDRDLDAWVRDGQDWRTAISEAVLERQRFFSTLLERARALRGRGLEETASSSPSDPLLARIAEARTATSDYETALLYLSRLEGRLIEEVQARRSSLGLPERLKNLAAGRIRDLWGVEIWVVGDMPVTVGKLARALGILLAGILLANGASRLFRRRLFRRERSDVHLAILTQRILYYAFLLLLVLFALRTVHIPLTAFAFLGGAVAVGIGLGAQEFFRNFISGLVLMLEKPIRIHDIITLDGELVVVREIGSRTTHVATFDGTDVFLPNSYFWENRIVNETYSGRSIKLKIRVGVAYGSPPEEVEAILLAAAEGHPRVKGDPPPYVRLSDFGETGLIFTLSCCLDQRDLLQSRRLLEDTRSDLRRAVAGLLAEAGIDPVPTRRLELASPALRPEARGPEADG